MSPWLFYVIDVVHSLRIVMIITAAMSTFYWAFMLPDMVGDRFFSDEGRDFVLILCNETIVQMLVAVTGTDIDNIRQIEEVTKAILGR